jgi:integrase
VHGSSGIVHGHVGVVLARESILMAKATKHYGKWRIRWVDENGDRKSEVFDDRREAAFQLQQRELEAEERRRGLKVAPGKPQAFGVLADYWVKHRVPQKRSGHHDESIIRKHLRPAFGTVTLDNPAIWIELVDRYVVAHANLNKKTVANHLTLLVTMLNVAVDLGWLTKVPRIRKPKVRLISQDFSYLRTDEEIGRLLAAAKEEDEAVAVFYATAVYTGARAGELAGLRWDDVDLEQRLITIQRSFDGPTKADDVRYVPVLDVLLPILRTWRLRHPGRLVFTNRDGGMLGPSGRIFQEVLHRVLARAEFPWIQRGGKRVRYIHFHDLRHTFASHWVMKGGDLFKLQKILGHKSVAMTLRYAHLQPAAFREDYARFGAGASTGAEVIALPQRTA